MKRFFACVFALVLTAQICVFPTFAEDVDSDFIAPSEIELNVADASTPNETQATGLITSKSIKIERVDGKIVATGYVKCISEVTRCGFSVLTLEKRDNSASPWRESLKLTNLCSDSTEYNLKKTFGAESGKQYRITCTFYARKNILSVQKVSGSTGFITL